jgi:DNA-binding NarL/FixJ family response regulator
MENPIRVLLADDHPLVRAGIRTTLNAETDLVLVGEVADANDVWTLCQSVEVDIVLLDLNMPGPPSAKTVAFLREHCPHCKVLVLTAYDDDAYIRGVISAGVAGYILKDEAPETVVRAIQAVMRGDTWFSRPVVDKLAHLRLSETEIISVHSLTARDREILSLIGQGWDNARIAEKLFLAEQTVRNRISQIYSKIGVSSRPEAVVWAREQGLVAP